MFSPFLLDLTPQYGIMHHMKTAILLTVIALVLFLFGPILASALNVVAATVMRVADLISTVPQIL